MRRVHPKPTWPGSRVLDIAAGQGSFALALAECGYVPRVVVDVCEGIPQKLPMALRRRACVHLAALLRRASAS